MHIEVGKKHIKFCTTQVKNNSGSQSRLDRIPCTQKWAVPLNKKHSKKHDTMILY